MMVMIFPAAAAEIDIEGVAATACLSFFFSLFFLFLGRPSANEPRKGGRYRLSEDHNQKEKQQHRPRLTAAVLLLLLLLLCTFIAVIADGDGTLRAAVNG